jgi:hypothetical protein
MMTLAVDSASLSREGGAVSELSMEIPGEDAAEQARAVSAEDGAADGGAEAEQDLSVPLEVDEADAAEQIRDVGYGDEDYR